MSFHIEHHVAVDHYFHNAGENELVKRLAERIASLESKGELTVVSIAEIKDSADALVNEFHAYAAQVAAKIADLESKVGDPVAQQAVLDELKAVTAEVQGAEAALNPPAAPTE